MSDYWRALRALWPAGAFFLLIIFVATLGYVEMGWSEADALYMVVITVFTVGYGEVQPVNTPGERAWTMFVIVCGWVGLLTTLGSVLRSVTDGELRRSADKLRHKRTMDHLKDHVIICGHGRIGQTVSRDLREAGIPLVVIDKDESKLPLIEKGILCIVGDATVDSVLLEAGLLRARALATVLPSDATNVFITLTARELSPDLLIIARGEQPSTERKLLQAGANEVVLPTSIGGQRIAHAITRPTISNLLAHSSSLDFHAMGIEIDELVMGDHTRLEGRTVAEVQREAEGGFLVWALRRDGQLIQDGLDELTLREGDSLLVVGRTRNLPSSLEGALRRTVLR